MVVDSPILKQRSCEYSMFMGKLVANTLTFIANLENILTSLWTLGVLT